MDAGETLKRLSLLRTDSFGQRARSLDFIFHLLSPAAYFLTKFMNRPTWKVFDKHENHKKWYSEKHQSVLRIYRKENIFSYGPK